MQSQTVLISLAGNLTINNPDDIHVIALRSPQRNHWRWRVQLPEDQAFVMRWKAGPDVAAKGIPDLPKMEGESSSAKWRHTDDRQGCNKKGGPSQS